MRLRDAPLAKKLRLIILIVAGTAILGSFAAFLGYQVVSSRAASEEQLLVMGAIVADQSTAALEFDQKDQAATILAALKSETQIVSAALYDRSGRVFARFARAGGDSTPVPDRPGSDGATFEGGGLEVRQPVQSGGERIGTLFLRSDLGQVWERLWINLVVTAIVLAGAFILILILSARLGRIVTGPVSDLAGVVKLVTAKKDYSVRAEARGLDELGELVAGFNEMLSEIQQRDKALAEGRADLEHRVELRTSELAKENAERRQAEVRLKEQDARLREAQQIARVGSWEWDLATQKVSWSDETYRIMGLVASEFPGTFEAFIRAAHPDDRVLMRDALEQAVRKREPLSLVHRFIRPDGEVRVVQVQAKVILDDAGRPIRLVGTKQDITERKRAEEAITELNTKLKSSVEELGALNKELEGFSYSVSHDLRAPLRAIDGFGRLLLDDYAPKLDDEAQRYINVIRSNTQKMGQLIDDLLSFSRMGRKHLEASDIGMTALARTVYDELAASVPDRKIEFRITDLPDGRGDLAMMRQVFTNLLSNAVKYTRTRPVAVIDVGSYDEGADTIYFVKDNGVGFRMEYAGKLFGVFQRLHGATEFEGTGVGLALVQRIIQRHGGRVWAQAKVNEGATFFFSLPRKEEGHGESDPDRSRDPARRGQSE